MFDTFVGIDQTGAMKGKGVKPLFLSITDGKRMENALYLDHCNHSHLRKKLEKHGFSTEKVFVLVDSCLGVPSPCDIGIRALIKKAKSYSFEDKIYGAATAHQFYQSLLTKKEIYHRKCELLAKANSPFHLKPYQRNIGCGSYRVLKDLAQDCRDLTFWPQEELSTWVVAEGYPTLAWENFQAFPPKALERKILAQLPKLSEDHSDACMLAWQAFRGLNFLKTKLPSIAKKEGWIFGLPPTNSNKAQP